MKKPPLKPSATPQAKRKPVARPQAAFEQFYKKKSADSEAPAPPRPRRTIRPAKGDSRSAERPARDAYPQGTEKRPYRRKTTPTETPAPDAPMRLNRYIASSGRCARRQADALIAAGRIKVNGEVVKEMGLKVRPGIDRVEMEGELLKPEKFVYILMNKPKDHVTTLSDPEGRRTVMDLVANATPERIYPVGRLDRNTTGLLLLTNDGELTKRLTHPAHQVRKLYKVKLDRQVQEADLLKLQQGVELEDGLAKADRVDYAEGGDGYEVGIELHSGKNRVVRRMFEALGYEVRGLDRVGFAHLTKKGIRRGAFRMLDAREVGFLKMI